MARQVEIAFEIDTPLTNYVWSNFFDLKLKITITLKQCIIGKVY